MNQLMRQLNVADVVVDPDDQDSKHDSIALREAHTSWRAGQRRRFVTARRLDRWLISDWQHKRRHMNLPELPFEPVRSGLFYSPRLGGTWVAADWWLQYFEVDERVTPLRLEVLAQDFNRLLLPLLPASTPVLDALPRENAKPSLTSQDEPQFSTTDLERIQASNPRWSAWENQLYKSM